MITSLIKDIALQTPNAEEENEILIYGLKILGTNVLTGILVILSGVIMGQTISAIIYLLVLILLRRNVGGYHSKTYIGCLLITLLNFMVIVALQNNLKQNFKEITGVIFIIYSTLKIYKTMPQVHKNRIVDEKAIENCNVKKKTNLSLVLFVALITHSLERLDLLSEINHFFAISFSLMIVAMSINKIKQEEDKKNEKSFNKLSPKSN